MGYGTTLEKSHTIIVVGKKGLLAGELETAFVAAGARVQRLAQTELERADATVDAVVFTSAMTHVDGCFREPVKGIEFTNLWLQKWLEHFVQLSVNGCRLSGEESAELGARSSERGARSSEHGARSVQKAAFAASASRGSVGVSWCRGVGVSESGVQSPESAARSTKHEARSTKFIYISTGGIFDGSPPAVKEDAPRGPVHPYGMVKALAEFQVMNSGLENWLIVRTDDLFSKDRPFNYPKGATDKFNKPTYAPDVAAGIVRLLALDFRGIIHVCGPELMSKFECVKHFNPDAQPITMAELNLPSPRPQYENLDTTLAESLGIRVRSIAEAVRGMNAEC